MRNSSRPSLCRAAVIDENNRSWAVAALPADKTGRVVNDLQDVYPVVPGDNVLATLLNNLNPIVHPIGCMLNAGWIDTSGKDFYFHKHRTTLSVARAIKAVYDEVKL